ncbi:helix-turn-helix transcriptional regulator [Streptomyces sp. NPDC006430]|uniref:helix-turn-helix domain-containing protein n=1 Tax=Streptomyces sp. NPDC006430 TaxID=3154299 RepID=UPI0033AB8D61
MADHIGQRIAARRHARRMTQADLAREAHVSLPMVKAIERGARNPGQTTLAGIASALGTDPSRLDPTYTGTGHRVRTALPVISAAIAGYEIPLGDAPRRPLAELRSGIGAAVGWRLAAQYGLIATHVPALLTDSLAHLHAGGRAESARLLVAAARTADAVAYKYGAHDLSARLIDVMRWAAVQADDADVAATAAYVHAETFLAARAHRVGHVALERALDSAPPPGTARSAAGRGALHMRAAVVAARAGNADAAHGHLREARTLANGLTEGVYLGTAFGPSSVRIHEVSVAVSLGRDHIGDALDVVSRWSPGDETPAERRSGFWIEVSRAQLWAGDPDGAFESLKTARRHGPQHVREHPWVRETIETIRRLKRAHAESLTHFAEWIGAV